MWWAGSNTRIYLSNQAALVCLRDGQRFSAQEDDWPTTLAAIGAQLDARHRRGGLQVLLSGGLARPFMQHPVDGIDTAEEALQVATASSADVTALNAPCAVWMDGWTPGKPCLAVAVEERLLAALRAFATDRGVRLRSVRPWWEAAVNDARHRLDKLGILALEDEDAQLLMVLANNRSEWSNVFCYAPPLDASQKAGTESRIAVAAGLTTAELTRARWSMYAVGEGADHTELGQIVWADSGKP